VSSFLSAILLVAFYMAETSDAGAKPRGQETTPTFRFEVR
jgi:hypothetical protein